MFASRRLSVNNRAVAVRASSPTLDQLLGAFCRQLTTNS